VSFQSFQAAAHLYQGMASIAESKTDVTHGEAMVRCARKALEEFLAARRYLVDSLASIEELVRFLSVNWMEDYEERLRQSGFKGALFILRDFKLHLERIEQALDVQIILQMEFVDQAESGCLDPRSFNPLYDSTTRGLCRALITFLDYEDQMAQTQMVNWSQQTATFAQQNPAQSSP
jgi:hypothetical protein